MTESRVYRIYSEGYSSTGDSARAFLLGTAEGASFEDACMTFVKLNPEYKKLFNKEKLTIWGCKLFDNIKDARKSFG